MLISSCAPLVEAARVGVSIGGADISIGAGGASKGLEAASKGVFRLWSKSEQVRPLWEYVGQQRKTDHPLKMAGFDCQFSSASGPSTFFPQIEAMFLRGENPYDSVGRASPRSRSYDVTAPAAGGAGR